MTHTISRSRLRRLAVTTAALAALAATGLVTPVAAATHTPVAPGRLSSLPAAANSPWQVVPGASFPANTYPDIYGITMIAPNDVWAVGDVADAAGQRTLAEHWNGTQWSVVPTPTPPFGMNGYHLRAVAAVSTTDVWAVGGDFNYHTTAIIEHWNGQSWSLVPSPTFVASNATGGAYELRALAVVSTTDVWAVAENNVIEHWNGTQWSVVPTPAMPTLAVFFTGVTAIATNDVWAVGYGEGDSAFASLIEHWNGAQWSVVPSPGVGSLGGVGVAAVSTNDVWAVGDRIEHWNGAQWSVVPSPHTIYTSANPINTLHSVAVVGPNDVWAVGRTETKDASGITYLATLTEQWNGTAWNRVPSPRIMYADNGLIGVAAVPSGTLWAITQAGNFLRNTNG